MSVASCLQDDCVEAHCFCSRAAAKGTDDAVPGVGRALLALNALTESTLDVLQVQMLRPVSKSHQCRQ